MLHVQHGAVDEAVSRIELISRMEIDDHFISVPMQHCNHALYGLAAEGNIVQVETIDLLILGIPTWGIGEIQDDWAVFLPGLKDLDLTGKKVAIFGLGDQESYPDTFSDALGTLYDSLSETGCEIIGSWSTLGYEFMDSSALRDGMFAGLVLDEENQPQLTDLRIKDWLETIIPNGKSEGQSSHI